jgi:hypothetical protein
MPNPNPLKSPTLFLRFWLEAFKEALKWGWGASGVMSLVIPDIIIALGSVDRLAHLALIKWVSGNPNLARLYCVAAVILAYLIYAPYRKYKETQIQCLQSMKRAWERMNVIGEARDKLQARIDELLRPKLILSEQRVFVDADSQVCFSFLVKNTGPGTAKCAVFTFAIQTTDFTKPPSLKEEPTSQPIIENTSRPISFCFPSIPPDPAYIVFHARYVGEDQKQWEGYPVFLAWSAVKNDRVSSELHYLTNGQIATFTEYLRKHEIPEHLLRALNRAPEST